MTLSAVARVTGAATASASFPVVRMGPTSRAATPLSGAGWMAVAGLLLAGSAAVSSKDQQTAHASAEQEEGDIRAPGIYEYSVRQYPGIFHFRV